MSAYVLTGEVVGLHHALALYVIDFASYPMQNGYDIDSICIIVCSNDFLFDVRIRSLWYSNTARTVFVALE